MNRYLIYSLRTLLVCCALCFNTADASASAPQQEVAADLAANGPEAKVTLASPASHSAAGAVNAPQSVPEAGFIVLLGSVLVALSAKARRGRQPS